MTKLLNVSGTDRSVGGRTYWATLRLSAAATRGDQKSGADRGRRLVLAPTAALDIAVVSIACALHLFAKQCIWVFGE